ncbi:hypothetical protein B0H15DRAFT_930352 [Mycena belliarum]|uniref:Nuclear condensin complex subunit 3 C-terminal domain-containing protein n=1 Tax=Mycena belliarum TaxID=1033014 RepID=A0AAD6U6R4_9AGAR|nr:hypothetical protein B0H15DRAFT_930352 [Mycena belliae]
MAHRKSLVNQDPKSLKQILACFTFAYSHSCPKNQRVIRELFVPAFRELAVLYRNCEGAQDSMVQVADMHVTFRLIRSLKRRPIQDGLANKALKRFDASISKQFEAQLKGFNEVEYSKLEELKDLFDFLDDIIPEEEETLSKPTAPSKQEKRMRSDSNTSDGSRGPSSAHAEARVKRPRLSDCESKFNGFDGDSAKSTPTLPPPPRSTPRHSVCVRYASEYKTLTIGRSVGAKRIHEVIVISSDSSEDEAVNVVRQKRSRSIKSQNPMVLPRQYVLVPDDSE